MTKITVGDIVELFKKDYDNPSVNVGTTGTVVLITSDRAGVKWNNYERGHDLDGILSGKDAIRGYYVRPMFLKIVKRDWKETLEC